MTLSDYFNRTIEKRRREYNNKGYAPGIFKEGHSDYARRVRTWYVGRHSELYSISDGMPSVSDGIPGLDDGWRLISMPEWGQAMNELVRSAGTRNDNNNHSNDNGNDNEFREWVLRRVAPWTPY